MPLAQTRCFSMSGFSTLNPYLPRNGPRIVSRSVVPFHPLLGEGSPTKIEKKQREGWYPYSNLSTGAPGCHALQSKLHRALALAIQGRIRARLQREAGGAVGAALFFCRVASQAVFWPHVGALILIWMCLEATPKWFPFGFHFTSKKGAYLSTGDTPRIRVPHRLRKHRICGLD